MSRSSAPEIIELLSDSDEEVAPDAAGAAQGAGAPVTPAPTAEGARDLDDEDEPMDVKPNVATSAPTTADDEAPVEEDVKPTVEQEEVLGRGGRRAGKKPKTYTDTAPAVDDSDDDGCIVAAPRARPRKQPAKTSNGAGSSKPIVRAAADDEDDDVVMEGRTGDLALSDFPHSREFCLNCKFIPGNEEQQCDNCFCFV